MGGMSIKVGVGALLLISTLWLLTDSLSVLALLSALLAHELGHILALSLCGSRVKSVKADARGLRMDYKGLLRPSSEVFCVVAGPVAGVLYTLVCASLGEFFDHDFFYLSAGISLALTVFNLLPVLPLDGGRLVSVLCGEAAAAILGLSVATVLCAVGLLLLYKGDGAGVFIASVWLLLSQKDI